MEKLQKPRESFAQEPRWDEGRCWNHWSILDQWVSEKQPDNKWYCHHLDIAKPNKVATSRRIVFDFSAKYEETPVNNIIHPPVPKLLCDSLNDFTTLQRLSAWSVILQCPPPPWFHLNYWAVEGMQFCKWNCYFLWWQFGLSVPVIVQFLVENWRSAVDLIWFRVIQLTRVSLQPEPIYKGPSTREYQLQST